MMKSLDLNDVRIFALTAEAGTFSAAGKTLGVPPSTVSRSLTRIEKHLGVSLMRRGSKGLVLTDSGRDYLQACRKALRVLKDAAETVDGHHSHPKGIIKIACPITMARDLLAPLMKVFLDRFPELRVEIDPYCSSFDQEPRDDIDVFFKLRAPKDSIRRIRSYPGTERGLFASIAYVENFGKPSTPEQLDTHRCIGMGIWRLGRGKIVATPSIPFCVIASDPYVHLTLGLEGVGICMLPLWLAKRSEYRDKLVPILPQWKLDPLILCALFSGQARLTPKVQALLDFLGEFIGTERDPRLRYGKAKDCFSLSSLGSALRSSS